MARMCSSSSMLSSSTGRLSRMMVRLRNHREHFTLEEPAERRHPEQQRAEVVDHEVFTAALRWAFQPYLALEPGSAQRAVETPHRLLVDVDVLVDRYQKFARV